MARSYLPSLFGREGETLGSLFRDVERAFEDFSRRSPFAPTSSSSSEIVMAPRIDVSETKDAIEVAAELPGGDEKDVDLTLADGVLTIRGEKKTEQEQKDKDYRLIERSYGAFYRTIELPVGIDPKAVNATMSKGVLKIVIPKPAPSQAQKIEVKAAA